ncbi:ATP-binding protein [Sandaracinus amylolyticus]|uniref:hybrid sensor histidine kinase/response regulator n=1 Tax=Sandaracinus amylolyticus TaxID=927083 RepID=UPI001F3C38DA|nr:ATP-binding protein [Sandaracinus amylolyticus]UJR83732.1 Hypothetical protein I5071_58030 [Sandaracinus amylolyticus]
MADLIPFAFGMGAADLVLFSVFAVLYLRERREHLRAWAWAHALDGARHLILAVDISIGGAVVLELASTILQTAGAWWMMDGAMRFAGRRSHRGWIAAALLVGVSGGVARWLALPFAIVHLPTSTFLGLARVTGALVLLRAEGTRTARTITCVALLLWGLHSWNYPFLREVRWFAPWGFTLATLLATCVGIGMLMLHLEQARREERASSARYQELFDGAIEGFFRTSPQGRFVAANPALVRMLGYEHESELLALDLMRDVYANAADRARILAHQDGDIDTVRLKRRDGSTIEVAVHGRRVRDAKGQVRWFEGSMRDVTEEQRLREELAQAQRMEALGRMAGGIAHDFNNVLGAIVAAADLARLRVDRGQQPTAELDDVRDSAMRAADLTRQLLALARRQPLHRRPLDLRDAVSASVRVLGRVIGERIEVEVSLAHEPLVVLADRGQIDQVLMNLALNARDAMPSGGRLHIATESIEIEGSAWARLVVEDTGVGMDDETRRHMFDPFFTTKRHGQGSGLGLAMVYGAVTQSGGRIDVESAPGEGTRIEVVLPLAVAQRAIEPVEISEEGPRRVARILLVEDEPALRRSVEVALRESGHEVRAAMNAAEAFDRWGEWPFDLLVTDVVMPGLSGPDLARTVRRRDPLCPVIFVTGYAAEPIDDALSEHAELLTKPFTMDALLVAVARRLETRDAASAAESTPHVTTA